MNKEATIIKNKFLTFQRESAVDTILYRLVPGIILLALLMLNDLFIIKNVASFYLRLSVFIFTLLTTSVYIFWKSKTKLISILYNIILASLPIMLYAKIIIHFEDEMKLFSSIIGAIVSLFIVAIELKTKLLYSIITFFIPIIILSFILFYNFENRENPESALSGNAF